MHYINRFILILLVFTIHQTSVFANNVCEEMLLAGADTQETLIERVVQAYEKLLSQTTLAKPSQMLKSRKCLLIINCLNLKHPQIQYCLIFKLD